MTAIAAPARTHRRRRWMVLALGLVAAGGIATVATGAIRWRAYTAMLQMTGQIPDIELGELIEFLHPDSGQLTIWRLSTTRNPYAVLHVPENADAKAGSDQFREQCATCHALNGGGGPLAPALFGREFKHGDSDWAIYRTIRAGVPATPMVPHPQLSSKEIWNLVAHIRSLDKTAGADAPVQVDPVTAHLQTIRLPYAELEQLSDPGKDWLTYSGTLSAHRRSSLSQITPANVNRLGLRWVHQYSGNPTQVETTPIVRAGIMYVTVPPGLVLAIDAATGRELWRYRHKFESRQEGEFGVGVNRGLALLDDKVFFGAWDARVIALSAATGKVVWDAKVDDHPRAYISSAPFAYKDLVVTGVGTIIGGGRGVIVAFDAATGKERWRFMAIPGDGEPGNDTWSGDSWREGGAPTWLTGSYDPEADLLYWGVGNPKPDYDTSVRMGDNLYSNSVVALQGASGKLVWHFQFTPADDHDWDSNQVPVLADFPTEAGVEKRLLWANRNAYYYVLDRITGKFITAVPFAKQNWAKGLDPNGRPIRSITSYSRQGDLIYPGATGATNWWSPALDSDRGVIYVPVLEQGMVFFPSAASWPTDAGRSFYTGVRALEARTGKLVWERRHPPRTLNPFTGGLLSTKTGVLFGSDQDNFFALDSATGNVLWSVPTGGTIYSAPVTYEVNGEQFLSISAGRNLMTFALPRN